MMKPLFRVRLSLLAGALLFFGAGCIPSVGTPPLKAVPAAAADHKNIAYVIDGQPFMLRDGYAEKTVAPDSASKSIVRYFGNEVRGDFDGNGTEDVAFLLTQDNGGSGTFYYLVAALGGTDGYRGTNAVLLGDRIAPQTTEFRDGVLIANYAERKTDPAASSVGVSKYFRVADGALSAADAPAAPSRERIDLSGQGLQSVPKYVFDRTDTEELDLSGNRLTGAIPAEIRHLRKLRVLDASGNRMTGVPAEIGQLSALEDLDLSENELTGLPLELGNLSRLRRLDLRGNDVSKQDLDAIRAKLIRTEILE